jgi:hypothetical protein
MKKIILVGGGITNCVIALFLIEKNYEVEIYEKSSALGGVLRDFDFEGEKFLRGVQYLDLENDWFKKVKKFFEDELKIFDHTYGCHVNSLDIQTYTKNFSVPTFKKIDISNIPNYKKNKLKTASDRLSIYGKTEKDFLSKIMKRHGLDVNNLNFHAPGSIQMSRIASLDNEEEIFDLKKKDKFLDNFFAIPRGRIFKEKLFACLPHKGFNDFFEKFHKILHDLGVKVFLSTNINPEWQNNHLKLYSNDILIENDFIIWSGNPTKLIMNYSGNKLDSFYLKILQINANINGDIPENIYLQIFSEYTDISRIYFYKINNVNKISIECIYNKNDPTKILNEAEKILKGFDYEININKEKIFKKLDIRFNVVSLNDNLVISNFLKDTQFTNLINSPWLHYGRDKKISFLLSELKKKKII